MTSSPRPPQSTPDDPAADRPHLPMRPLWGCGSCPAEWPCPTARHALLAEYRNDRTALRIYLGALMAEAAEQLAQVQTHPTADLHRRFLLWV
ncbi:hypothetical protein [Salinispora fenicalii]|uniref:hypothetical protein n=1 Tax=Salinispora fenicalii TaxID=1137263 RepID=UPI0003AA0BB2|nr:hypothetical protein [Salinispora fenicalii]